MRHTVRAWRAGIRCKSVHPIERLRFIARAGEAPAALVVAEAASALQATAADPRDLLTACRRLIAWRPGSGPLVWLAARMVAAVDPVAEAQAAAAAILNDCTAQRLACAVGPCCRVAVIADGEIAAQLPTAGADPDDCDLALVETEAFCELGALCPPGTSASAEALRARGVDVWLVAGAGRLLPPSLWSGLRGLSASRESPGPEMEVVALDLFERVAGPNGPVAPAEALEEIDCPPAAELFR